MTNPKYFRVAIMIAAALAASGCGLFKRGSGPKTPVLGQRIPVLTSEGDAQVDLPTAAIPMSLPAAVANTEWAQSGGDADKSMGHLALGTALSQAFMVQAGRGSSLTMRLASSPIVANGRVYTIDTLGAVRSFDAKTGAMYWASQTPNDKGNERSLYGGGIAYDNGRIYATNGLGYVSALSEQTGGILWQVRPGGPLRGRAARRPGPCRVTGGAQAGADRVVVVAVGRGDHPNQRGRVATRGPEPGGRARHPHGPHREDRGPARGPGRGKARPDRWVRHPR